MHDVKGIWIAIAISFAVSLTCSMAYYFSGHWMRRVVRRPPPAPAQAATGQNPAKVFANEAGEA